MQSIFLFIYLSGFALPVTPVFGQSQAVSDGPYVFYKGNQVVVKTVAYKDGGYVADSVTFPAKAKQQHVLKVHIDSHPEWDFTVKLRRQISNEPVSSPGSANVFAVSDIEGEFEPFRNLLLAAKVIDTHYHWTFGKGSLLIAGDLFDRGKQVTQYLWLLYKLEDEARDKGGAVHVILGNHELMNLSGDTRYVAPQYFDNCVLLKEDYDHLYDGHTELGRWLRSKNIIEKDGEFLVVHGGIATAVLQQHQDLAGINSLCRPYYGATLKDIPDRLKLFFGPDAPFWYRGYFLEPKASMAQIDSTLAWFKVSRILVGHDIIDHVTGLYDKKIIGLDVNEHEGVHEGLLILDRRYYRIDDHGTKTNL